ncbi:MAG: hypothetical protein KAQ98_11290 [Bacteriovoracaceae bacterium]|nr:hypothetical protein [Bacteriovoracaceae bacterium]
MAQCLLVEEREKISALYSLNLRVYTGLDVIRKVDLEGAIELLKVVSEIDIIVVKRQIGHEQTAVKLYEYVESLDLPIPIVVIGFEKKLKGKVKMLETAGNMKILITTVAKILGITARQMANQPLPHYYHVPLKYLLQMTSSNCDIFIKISRKDTSPQYIKILRKDEKFNFTKNILTKYLDKGIEDFYILSILRIRFVKCFTSQVVSKIHEEDLSMKDRLKITEVSLDFVSKEILSDELSEEVVTMAKAGVYSMIRFTEESGVSELKEILLAFIKEKTSFRYQLAQLITFLACHSISKMDWGTKEQQQKIGYVAFFHDILLNSDKLAMIFHDEELEEAGFSNEEKKLVRNHAVWTLEYLDCYPKTPFGANILIKQHHGAVNGVGFSKTFSSRLSPLAIVFIASEHYAREILRFQKENFKFIHFDIVRKLDKVLMEKVKYRKVIETFQQIFK